jgi:hypothetical protein
MTNQETTKVEEKNRQSTDEDIRELIRRESRGYDVLMNRSDGNISRGMITSSPLRA